VLLKCLHEVREVRRGDEAALAGFGEAKNDCGRRVQCVPYIRALEYLIEHNECTPTLRKDCRRGFHPHDLCVEVAEARAQIVDRIETCEQSFDGRLERGEREQPFPPGQVEPLWP